MGRSFINYMAQDSKMFEVGDGATICMWSDRQACTVVKVTPKTATLREDHAKRVDQNGMSDAQTYEYAPNPDGRVHVARLTKRGWRIGGQTGNAVVHGRAHYYDYTF